MSNKVSLKQTQNGKLNSIMKQIPTESSNRKNESNKLDHSNVLTDSPS